MFVLWVRFSGCVQICVCIYICVYIYAHMRVCVCIGVRVCDCVRIGWIGVYSHFYVGVCMHMMCVCVQSFVCKVAKTYRIPYLHSSFSAKELYTYWLFGKKRPAIQDILCIFTTLFYPIFTIL